MGSVKAVEKKVEEVMGKIKPEYCFACTVSGTDTQFVIWPDGEIYNHARNCSCSFNYHFKTAPHELRLDLGPGLDLSDFEEDYEAYLNEVKSGEIEDTEETRYEWLIVCIEENTNWEEIEEQVRDWVLRGNYIGDQD